MSILIKGMEMPTQEEAQIAVICPNGYVALYDAKASFIGDYKAISIPPHGRLIDADALRQAMYHEAFETDSPMQKWDSGCWIRYKMFERTEETAPTIIPAEEEDDG